jgi:hypothetical protein
VGAGELLAGALDGAAGVLPLVLAASLDEADVLVLVLVPLSLAAVSGFFASVVVSPAGLFDGVAFL